MFLCAMFRIFAFVLSMAFCLLGCAQVQLEHQSDSFNRAGATTLSDQVLLNAVRASLDLPMSFTKLQKFTAGNMASGSLVPKLPFGPDASSAFDLGPTLNWSSGVTAIEFVDVNNGTALAKLNASLQYDTMDRYLGQGFHGGLLETILTEYVEVHEELADAFKNALTTECKHPTGAFLIACSELKRIHTRCKGIWSDHAGLNTLEGGDRYYIVPNRAGTECAYLDFRSFLLTLALAGYRTDLKLKTEFVPMKTPDGKTVPVKQAVPQQIIRFQNPAIHSTFQRVERKLRRYKNRQPFKHSFRSARSILSYLGELIALQNFSPDKFVPDVLLSNGKTMILFHVVCGESAGERAAVAVRGPFGKTFYVPEPDYGSPGRDQTLRVLAIASEVVNAAISEKDIPPPTSVVVQAIQ